MKNVIILQLNEEGNIHCQQLTEKGIEYVKEEIDEGYWEEGGTIVIDDLAEILNKEI